MIILTAEQRKEVIDVLATELAQTAAFDWEQFAERLVDRGWLKVLPVSGDGRHLAAKVLESHPLRLVPKRDGCQFCAGRRMTAEDIADAIRDRLSGATLWFGPIWTIVDKSHFEVTMDDGTTATITVTEGHK